MSVKQWIAALGAGVLFGFGLALSEMANPARVLGFLAVAGTWDPTLAFVMAGALIVTLPAFQLLARRPAPLFAGRFQLPTKKDLDLPLIGGSALFGVGWGLVGFCPGPAIASLAWGLWPSLVFVAAMLAGAWLGNHANRAIGPAAAIRGGA